MFLSKKSFLQLANVWLGFIPFVQSHCVLTCAGLFAAAESASLIGAGGFVKSQFYGGKHWDSLQMFSKSVNLKPLFLFMFFMNWPADLPQWIT